MLGLALVIVLSQPTITLVLRDEERTVSVAEAERLLKSEDQSLQVAATLALGTRTTEPELITHLSPWNLHRERFQRQPAQAQIPDDQ